MSGKTGRILWHSGFRDGIKVTFRKVRNRLSVIPEHQLSKEAIRMEISDGSIISHLIFPSARMCRDSDMNDVR